MVSRGGPKERTTRLWLTSCWKLRRASLEWATDNGVAFDHEKTQMALYHKKRTAPTATVIVGAEDIAFSKEVTKGTGNGPSTGYRSRSGSCLALSCLALSSPLLLACATSPSLLFPAHLIVRSCTRSAI
jgi:hypothetical protein